LLGHQHEGSQQQRRRPQFNLGLIGDVPHAIQAFQEARERGWRGRPAVRIDSGDLAADILSDIAAEERAKVVYQYLYRQINDKSVRETIDFLLNREEAHNTFFREAFNRIKDTGSLKDWAVTNDSKLYFDLSSPGGQYFASDNAKPPEFTKPN